MHKANQRISVVHYWAGKPRAPTSRWRECLELIRACVARGWRTTLVWSAHPDSELERPFVDAGCEIVIHPRPSGNFDWSCVLRTHRLLRALGCQLFHCHNVHTSPLIGAAMARVPVRVWSKLSMSSFYEQANRPRGIHRLQLSTWVSVRLAHRILAISRAVADEVLRQGASPSQVQVFAHGVDLSRYRTDAAPHTRLGLGLGPDDFVITAVGHAVPVKGWDILVQAFSKVLHHVPRARLLLVGSIQDPDEAAMYRDVVARVRRLRLDPYVVFAGTRNDIPQILASSDVFAMPSRSEGLGLALVEAQAAGLPCVATRVGGIPDVLEHGQNGLLVAREDADGLADALLQLVRQPEVRAQLSQGARLSARRFEVHRTVENAMAVYEELLRTRT